MSADDDSSVFGTAIGLGLVAIVVIHLCVQVRPFIPELRQVFGDMYETVARRGK